MAKTAKTRAAPATLKPMPALEAAPVNFGGGALVVVELAALAAVGTTAKLVET
jgi:hypothetical protein